MRSRCLLHKSKLEDFAAWLIKQGWWREDTKGDYEVLRMRHEAHRDPLLVYDRLDAKEHLTTHGIANKMAGKFCRENFYGSIPEDSMA